MGSDDAGANATTRAIERIRRELGELVESIEEGKGYISVRVPSRKLREAAVKLKNIGFDHVKSLTVIDYKSKGVFEVMYMASSYLNEDLSRVIVALTIDVDRNNPRLPSLSDIWTSVEFQEREVYEFFGIEFMGHPDLRPLLLVPDVADLRPLTKDFIVKEEPIIRS